MSTILLSITLFITLFNLFIASNTHKLHHDEVNYCRYAVRSMYDPEGECFTSAAHDVANACSGCVIINGTGTFSFCDSVSYAGFSNCEQPGAIDAMRADCETRGGTYTTCLTNDGSIKNETLEYNRGLPVATPNSGYNLVPSIFLVLGVTIMTIVKF
jgi:hypothetical protein